MTANPVLVEMTRGGLVENRHRGAVCVTDMRRGLVRTLGDGEAMTFPRSAIKAIQALALFRSGAVEKFDLDEEMLALACASHNAEDVHVDGVRRFLSRIGASEDDLECGAHVPGDRVARNALRDTGGKPGAIHNNCSGKHAGMLAVAKALDAPTEGYVKQDHPAQKLVRECIEAVIGEPLSEDRCGTDGCSIPTWAAPLCAFAIGFSRMATGEELPDDLASASQRLFTAATVQPRLIRGTGTFDTEVMELFAGRLMIKIGAEGVFCGARTDTGVGFSLKCDDGKTDAAEAMVAALLLEIADPDEKQADYLRGKADRALTNWRGIEVGRLAAVGAFGELAV